MELAHAGDDRLSGVLVGPDLEGRILLRELGQRQTDLLLVGLRLRLDRQAQHRIRELDRLENDRALFGADRVAGADGLEADDRDDVAGARLLQLLALVGVHLKQATDALLATLGDVVDTLAGLQNAGVDAREHQLPDKRVCDDLEDER